MNADIRISVGFPNHPKTVKLDRRLGFQGIRSLRALWTWAAQNRPDGNLGGANVVSGVRSNEGSTAAQRREPDVGSTRAPFVWRVAPTNSRSTVVQRSLDEENIEIAAQWPGEPGLFVATLVTLGWLDRTERGYLLHEWEQHDPWMAAATNQSDKARFSRMAKTHPDIFKCLCERAGDQRRGVRAPESGLVP